MKYSPSTTARIILNGPVNCQTVPYRPAIFTAQDDDSVGDILTGYSNGYPFGNYYGVAALTFNTGVGASASLSNLRIRFLRTAIISTMSANATLSLTNCQFVQCQTGVYLNNNNRLNLRNALFATAQTAISDGSYYGYTFVDAQQVTFDHVTYLASRYAPPGYILNMNLTNCVVTSVSQLSAPGQGQVAWYGDYNGFYPSSVPTFGSHPVQPDANPFLPPTGAGNYYLDTDARGFRNKGTANIDPTLLADLKKKTTRPPLVYDGTLTTLLPRGLGDTDVPDLGYHYDVLDYCVSGASSALTLANGVAVGIYGAAAVQGGTLVSLGTPAKRNQIALYSAVQEQPVPWVVNASATYLLNSWTSGTRFRFTDITLAGGAGFCSSSSASSLELKDCSLHAAKLTITGGYGATLGFTNNIIERCDFVLLSCSGATYFANFYNNLFLNNGNLGLGHACDQSILLNFAVRNNFFVKGSFTHGTCCGYFPQIANNGYYQTTVTSQGASPVTINDLDFLPGVLGPYYYKTTGGNLSQLIDAGSMTAADAKLDDYTTRTDQTPDSGTVDIGFHYKAAPPCANPSIEGWVFTDEGFITGLQNGALRSYSDHG